MTTYAFINHEFTLLEVDFIRSKYYKILDILINNGSIYYKVGSVLDFHDSFIFTKDRYRDLIKEIL